MVFPQRILLMLDIGQAHLSDDWHKFFQKICSDKKHPTKEDKLDKYDLYDITKVERNRGSNEILLCT